MSVPGVFICQTGRKESDGIRNPNTKANQHTEQCSAVPETSINPEIHSVHLESCYKKKLRK